jgi:hypothetical protein
MTMDSTKLTIGSVVSGTRRPCGYDAPFVNRVGIQNWRMASTTAGISRQASRAKKGAFSITSSAWAIRR